MAERHLFLHSVMGLAGGIALSCGLMADAAEQDTHKTVEASKTVQIAPAPANNAIPTEHYRSQVAAAVEKQWLLYKSQRSDGVGPGKVQTEFYITKHGAVETPRVVDATESHAVLTGLTMRAIRDAALPPMPEDVFSSLPSGDQGRLKIEYTASILPLTPSTASTPSDKARLGALLDQAAKDLSESDFKAPKALPVEDQESKANVLPFKRVPSKAPPADENTPQGRYIRQVLAAVEKKWRLYVSLRRDAKTIGTLEIEFFVNKKGKVENYRIVNDKESNPTLTHITRQAVYDAEIPPMPADVVPLLPLKDRERLKIEYNVLIY